MKTGSMKNTRRHWAAATVACALLAGACASTIDAPKGEKLGTNSQELLALSLVVNSAVLGAPGVVLRVTGPSYDATITGPAATRLPAITGDGTYTIASPAGGAPFGTFVVEGGIVVHATGAVTFASNGLSFNATKLASIVIPTTTLTSPLGLGRFRLGSASNAFQGSPFFRLPDGTWSLTAADGTRPLGTFTITNRLVTATTGALVKQATGLGFTVNTALLARVNVPMSTISSPFSLASARLGDDTTATGASMTAFLPDGMYAVTNNDKDRTFGSFTVAGRTVAAASGGLTVAPLGAGVVFNPAALARVTVNTSALATQATFQAVRIPKISGTSISSASFLLPPGTYDVDDALSVTSAPRRYGSITVAGTSVTAATGALTPTPTGFAFDLSGLAEVKIPFSGLKSPVSSTFVVGRLSVTGAVMGIGGDPLLHLLDGRYTVSRVAATSSAALGTFDVANHEVVAGGGIFKASATGKLELQTCGLAAVTIVPAPPPLGATSMTIPELVQGFSVFSGGTVLLPPGTYTVRPSNGLPSARFTVPTQGPITNVIQPTWLRTLSGTNMGTCLKPPVARCVGTAAAPVDIGFCSVAADATNALAGTCTDNGGGVASCELDGMTTRDLSAGDHSVLVTASASDGSSASCTSFVRVAPCGDAPVVTCVGTSAKPAVVGTTPGTCGVGVSAVTKVAGTCKPGITGLASCTFNGASATSLAPGSHTVAVVGTSDTGASASCTSYVRVLDTERPQITCAEPVTRECEGPIFHATPTASCTDSCGRCDTECNSGDLGLGYNVLGCNSVDTTGNTAFCSTEITIVDTIAPALEMTVSPSVLWAPNHKMVPISIATTTSDVCDPYAYVHCSAWSNEAPLGLGSGHTAADIDWQYGDVEGGPNAQLFLRAERSGLGADRIYTVECTAWDQSGNTTTKTATVTVPRDQGN